MHHIYLFFFLFRHSGLGRHRRQRGPYLDVVLHPDHTWTIKRIVGVPKIPRVKHHLLRLLHTPYKEAAERSQAWAFITRLNAWAAKKRAHLAPF